MKVTQQGNTVILEDVKILTLNIYLNVDNVSDG